MPFTPAHPVIILPFLKFRRFSATALIVGSMIPDFEYFFQLREVENVGHHVVGILLFDLPIGILICYLFHLLIRNVFIEHLPYVLKSRFIQVCSFNWHRYVLNNMGIVFLSLLLGIGSHLFFDAFTHEDGFMVEWLPVLNQSIVFNNQLIPVYFLLQLLFSVIGLVIVGMVISAIKPIPTVKPTNGYGLYWLLFSAFFLLILLVRLLLWPELNSFGGIAIAVMGSISYSWLLISVLFKIYIDKKPAL